MLSDLLSFQHFLAIFRLPSTAVLLIIQQNKYFTNLPSSTMSPWIKIKIHGLALLCVLRYVWSRIFSESQTPFLTPTSLVFFKLHVICPGITFRGLSILLPSNTSLWPSILQIPLLSMSSIPIYYAVLLGVSSWVCLSISPKRLPITLERMCYSTLISNWLCLQG